MKGGDCVSVSPCVCLFATETPGGAAVSVRPSPPSPPPPPPFSDAANQHTQAR